MNFVNFEPMKEVEEGYAPSGNLVIVNMDHVVRIELERVYQRHYILYFKEYVIRVRDLPPFLTQSITNF